MMWEALIGAVALVIAVTVPASLAFARRQLELENKEPECKHDWERVGATVTAPVELPEAALAVERCLSNEYRQHFVQMAERARAGSTRFVFRCRSCGELAERTLVGTLAHAESSE